MLFYTYQRHVCTWTGKRAIWTRCCLGGVAIFLMELLLTPEPVGLDDLGTWVNK